MEGKVINGYKIIGFVGKGQFGTVYKCAKEPNSGAALAIKIFNLDYVYNEFRTNGEDNRVTREIQALKMVTHKNVIALIDEGVFVENSQTYVYIVMEFIEGNDLAKYIKSHDLPWVEIQYIFKQLVDGIDAIHKTGIVHRDLKPQNIFITKNKTVKILDFGLSKLIDFTSITNTGDTIGSPLYMSPEQIKDSKNIDYRSDYYALGVILFELITKTHPYGELVSREQLYFKIISETPISILQYAPAIPNCIDNLITTLLNKSNYLRPNSSREILELFDMDPKERVCNTKKDFLPSFFLRTWNEKSVLEDYYKDGFFVENVVFPINHQTQQKNLLRHIRERNINYFIDPATMRLAYDTFADVKGLVALPYAPQGYNRLELDGLADLTMKRDYVKLVVDEQMKYDPSYIVAPFHVSNNSNLVSLKNSNIETWFTLDMKLLKETQDYLVNGGINKRLVGGFCIKSDILTSQSEKEYFLNVLSGLPCDMYWVYVDCIDNNTSSATIYHYFSALLELQRSTNKPVVAGRVGAIGLVLLAFGLYGFEAGSARFESFYEDLYKDDTDSFNMYVMYYIPELMKNVAIERKNPAKLLSLLKANAGVDLACKCPYCKDKKPEEFLVEPNTRKHFLYRRQEEIDKLKTLSVNERLDYMEDRIKKAIGYYRSLSPIFKDSDYSFLKVWQKVIRDLRIQRNV